MLGARMIAAPDNLQVDNTVELAIANLAPEVDSVYPNLFFRPSYCVCNKRQYHYSVQTGNKPQVLLTLHLVVTSQVAPIRGNRLPCVIICIEDGKYSR